MRCRLIVLRSPHSLQVLKHVAGGQDEERNDGKPARQAEKPERMDYLENDAQDPKSHGDPECNLSWCAEFHGVPPTQKIVRRLIVLRKPRSQQG